MCYTLLMEADTPIERHIKIKGAANPYDTQWAPYFQDRWGKKILNSARGRSKLIRVWLRQDRQCHSCHAPITKSTPWTIQYKVKKTEGGTDAASNLQMHHLQCHRKMSRADKEVM